MSRLRFQFGDTTLWRYAFVSLEVLFSSELSEVDKGMKLNGAEAEASFEVGRGERAVVNAIFEALVKTE